MKLLVSACLLGTCCRYDGGGFDPARLLQLKSRHTLIPVCPEQLGGLPTPRTPAERREGRVVTADGQDVSAAFSRGAEEALRLATYFGCTAALLKERSPSCGHGTIYDGSFTGKLTPGDGVTAALLEKNGVRVYGESQIDALLAEGV